MSPPLFVKDHPKLIQELEKVGYSVGSDEVTVKKSEHLRYDVVIVGGGTLWLMPISLRLENCLIDRYGWMCSCRAIVREFKRESAPVGGWRKVVHSK